MAMAVTHLVSVVSGGVNVHAAFALVAANDMDATTPDRHANSLHCVVMDVSSHVDFGPSARVAYATSAFFRRSPCSSFRAYWIVGGFGCVCRRNADDGRSDR